KGEGNQEKSQDEEYDGDDDEGEEFKISNWETENGNRDDEYIKDEDVDDGEDQHEGSDKSDTGDEDNDTAWNVDMDEGDEKDDFQSRKNHLIEDVVDEDMARMNRPPTAPTSMVVFYTWMIVAVLIFVVGISMYQSRCHGFRLRLPFTTSLSSGSDRKRLHDHQYI
ncbi:unnamed protein product, partial [Candidula unifasciata]